MQKNLVIVESPAKAKTIEKFLGKDFKVLSSYGHIRDLKKKEFSIDVDKDFKPHYEIPADKKKLVTQLKEEAEQAETVWLASDEDREGEAIAWHLFEVLKLKPENTKRIVFHEITKDAILHAIQNPRNIDKNLVDANRPGGYWTVWSDSKCPGVMEKGKAFTFCRPGAIRCRKTDR